MPKTAVRKRLRHAEALVLLDASATLLVALDWCRDHGQLHHRDRQRVIAVQEEVMARIAAVLGCAVNELGGQNAGVEFCAASEEEEE